MDKWKTLREILTYKNDELRNKYLQGNKTGHKAESAKAVIAINGSTLEIMHQIDIEDQKDRKQKKEKHNG